MWRCLSQLKCPGISNKARLWYRRSSTLRPHGPYLVCQLLLPPRAATSARRIICFGSGSPYYWQTSSANPTLSLEISLHGCCVKIQWRRRHRTFTDQNMQDPWQGLGTINPRRYCSRLCNRTACAMQAIAFCFWNQTLTHHHHHTLAKQWL